MVTPMGMKNMLATLCSKPLETKAMIGKKMAKILPTISLAAKAIHTARHTSQLQQMARKKACPQVRVSLPLAIARALAPWALIAMAPPAAASGPPQ